MGEVSREMVFSWIEVDVPHLPYLSDSSHGLCHADCHEPWLKGFTRASSESVRDDRGQEEELRLSRRLVSL